MKTIELLRPAPGLRVLISGAAAGIGAAIAQAFLDVDADVYICDANPVAIDRAKTDEPRLRVGVADVADREQVDRVVDDARAKLGGLDILVNNAGIAGPTCAVEDIDPDEWERTVCTNLNSQFYFVTKAVPVLKETSLNPCIIAMASVAGRLGYPYRTPYAASKWAIVGMVKSLAIELGPSKVRVNAILPGAVEGERMDRVISARADARGVGFDQMKSEYLAKISLRRMVTVHDVAALTLFLASPAGQNVSGQAISVDGNVEYL